MAFIAIIVVGLLLYAIIGAGVRAPGRSLASKFGALGEVVGLPLDQVIAKVGCPTAVSSLANGQKLVQWQATGYHIAMTFDVENKCLGIDHEFLAR